MKRILALLTLGSLLISVAWAQLERAGTYRVNVSVTPRQVPADGQSQARLRVEMRDERGHSVPDGTQFVAHTDLGLLSFSSVGRQDSLTGRTSGGFAIILVTSTTPGTATVTIQAADSRAVAYVDFLPEGEAAQGEARVVDITGGWVGYNLDAGAIEARDCAKLRFGKLVLECGGMLQVNVENLTIKAQDVIIRRGDQQLKGEDVFLDLISRRGIVRRFGEERLERVYFDLVGLRPLTTEWDVPTDAFKMNKGEADSWLVAKSISLFVNEKVVLKHAALWVQEQKIFTFPPYWIIGLPGYSGASNTQALGVTSEGDVAIDFPFFYRVTDRATGAIKIQRGARSSSFTSRDGWSLAIAEEYRSAGGAEGTVEVSGLTKPDWGLEWRDSRPMFGDGSGYFDLALPDHKSIYSDANIMRYSDRGRLSLRGYYDGPDDYEQSWGALADWLAEPNRIGSHNLAYRLGTSVGVRQYAADEGVVFANELFSELSLGERSWGKATTLQPSISNVYSWDTGGYAENSLRADLRLDHKASRKLHFGFDYSAELRHGDADDEGWNHVFGFDARAYGSKWNAYLSSTYDLTTSGLYGYATLDYHMDPKWRWGLTGTYYDLENSQYQDLELSLGRLFGSREINLVYSTDTQRFSISLGGFGLK
ncbi:MAG: hypothetical protein ABFE07_20450 [Armatimonadia bacterium]